MQQPEKKSMHWAAAGWQLFNTYCYHWKLSRQIRILKERNKCIESSYGCSLSDLQSLLSKGLPLTGTAEIFHTHTHRQAPAHTCRHTHHLCRHTPPLQACSPPLQAYSPPLQACSPPLQAHSPPLQVYSPLQVWMAVHALWSSQHAGTDCCSINIKK